MSGTSLDGLDIAQIEVSNQNLDTKLRLVNFTSIAYDNEYLSLIRPLFANPQAASQDISCANVQVAQIHAAMVLSALGKWGVKADEIDVLASHGQTILHQPEQTPNTTCQIGDGDHLAHFTNILTVSDFRQKHIAAGGEGAPLVPYADYLLYTSPHENRIMLNIGGISNFCYLPKNTSFDSVVSADLGPGNTLMDAYIKRHNLHPSGYDKNASIAAQGEVYEPLLQHLLNDPYFSQSLVSSTGPEYFNLQWLDMALTKHQGVTALSEHANILATLNAFTAKTIANALRTYTHTTQDSEKLCVYVSGGGANNPLLMANIQKYLPQANVASTAALGMPVDAKEAALFAVLANQTLFGSYAIFENSSNTPAVSLGKISLPN